MDQSIAERMRRLGVAQSEFEEIFARSSGPGGQRVNKVSTAVTLRHLPSGLAGHRAGFALSGSQSSAGAGADP